MQISSRFTIAIHIFACIDTFRDEHKLTSDFLAGSINVNPVIIRKVLQQLKKANLVSVKRGSGGVDAARPLSEITLLDIFRAVDIFTIIRILPALWEETFTRRLMTSLRVFSRQWKGKCGRSLLRT
mgnify:CR=1 FL=1